MRLLLLFSIGAAVAAALATGATAQSLAPAPGPDAYVRGVGVITVPPPPVDAILPANSGILHVNVYKVGTRLLGGFSYREVTPDGKVVDSIVSRIVKSADIEGNKAEITAEGLYGKMPACLRLEVVDDPGAGDWYRISANGCMLTVIYYDASGGLKSGDLQVWKRPAPPKPARAVGAGAIRIPLASQPGYIVGSFKFQAETTPLGPKGGISYATYDPRTASIINRPIVTVFVPKINHFEVTGNSALLVGIGTYNGKPATVHVVGVDNNKPGPGPVVLPIQPDRFSIKVYDPVATVINPIYQAEGLLFQGDIAVMQALPML